MKPTNYVFIRNQITCFLVLRGKDLRFTFEELKAQFWMKCRCLLVSGKYGQKD